MVVVSEDRAWLLVIEKAAQTITFAAMEDRVFTTTPIVLSGEGDGILAKVLAQGRTRVFSFGQPASLKLWNDEFDKLADVVHG